ncbi:MAG: hypothetical protein ABI352_00435 [Candidatus Dormibacter sp.]
MQFSFAGRSLPMTVRMCRSLVWTQAAFVILGGAFVIFAATVFGGSNAVPVHGDALSGNGAVVLGFVYLVVGAVLAYLGVELGRLAPWVRNVLAGAQVFLAVLLLVRAFDLSVSTVLNILFCAAIVGLLFAPDTSRAFQSAAASSADPA